MSDYSVDPGATIERLIAERDAALASEAKLLLQCGGMQMTIDKLQQRVCALAQNLKFAEEGYQSFAEECDKLQQRLTGSHQREARLQDMVTAADERVDVLEGRVSMLLRELQELINDEDGILVVAELSTGFAWHALQKHGKAIEVALKPAEPATDEHVCTGCGSKGWTANCKECVPY